MVLSLERKGRQYAVGQEVGSKRTFLAFNCVVLNKSGKIGHSCLVPNLRVRRCVLSISIVYAIFMIDSFKIISMMRYFPHIFK